MNWVTERQRKPWNFLPKVCPKKMTQKTMVSTYSCYPKYWGFLWVSQTNYLNDSMCDEDEALELQGKVKMWPVLDLLKVPTKVRAKFQGYAQAKSGLKRLLSTKKCTIDGGWGSWCCNGLRRWSHGAIYNDCNGTAAFKLKDWCEEKNAGHTHISWENRWVPVNFFL